MRQVDPRGKPTAFAYDPLNRLTQLTDARGGVTRFTYDGNGNLLTVTDARGSVTSHTYDAMDRLATRTDPVGGIESFAYDGVGNLVRHVDRKGQGATFSYDALNRRTGAIYADGSTTSFAYDSVGRLIQATDSVGGTILNTYDPLDRLLAQTTGLGTVSYAYDAPGRRTRMDAPGQASVFYGYDAASRLRTITQAPLNPVAIDYDALGRRTLLTLPNGVSTAYQYDAASRLTALIYRNALGALGDLTYTYDAAGNRTAVGGSFARTLLPDPVTSAIYDPANRQLTFGDKTLTYDANGNLTSITDPSGVTTFTWDARNRLAALNGPNVTTSFTYDPLGRRLSGTINGALTQYLYDGLDIVQVLDAAGTSAYLRSLIIDEPLVRNGTEFYLADPLGSILGLTDPSGIFATRYLYEPFGRTTVEGTSSANPFQYTAREHDALAGLYFYRARYYHPILQRFTAEDPLRGLLIRNVYEYVANNPHTFIDPLGLLEFSTFGGFTLRVNAPFTGFDVSLGFRSGTQGFGQGRVELFGSARAFPAGGASVGRGFFFGAALRDVSKVSGLTETFVDSPIGSVSLFFDRDELVGIGIGGPSAGLGAGLALPKFSLEPLNFGINFPTDLSNLLFGLRPVAEEITPLAGRKR